MRLRIDPTLPYTSLTSPRLMLIIFSPSSSPAVLAFLRAYQRNSLVHITIMTHTELDCVLNMSYHASSRHVLPYRHPTDSRCSTLSQRPAQGFQLSTTHMPSSNGLIRTVRILSAYVVDPVCLACLTLIVYVSWP